MGTRGSATERSAHTPPSGKIHRRSPVQPVFRTGQFRYNQWGRIKIMQALRLKNIPDTCCREALAEIEEEEYLCVLRKLLQSKARSVKAASDYERNGKLIRFGLSRGFEMNAITRSLHVEEEDFT